ncbi:hypothetical protein LDENG_00160080 [Lucifuga dentata]|nr:hypothetical protein LDENG_00160080 [Lucifuga dentata]
MHTDKTMSLIQSLRSTESRFICRWLQSLNYRHEKLCSEFPPEPPKPHPNGKKCFSCAVNDPQCTTALNCEGDEDRCVSATMTIGSQKVDMKGCASKSICTGAQTAQIPGMSASVSCCEGDFCNSSNSASSITVNLLLLLLPLLSSVLF